MASPKRGTAVSKATDCFNLTPLVNFFFQKSLDGEILAALTTVTLPPHHIHTHALQPQPTSFPPHRAYTPRLHRPALIRCRQVSQFYSRAATLRSLTWLTALRALGSSFTMTQVCAHRSPFERGLLPNRTSWAGWLILAHPRAALRSVDRTTTRLQRRVRRRMCASRSR